MREMAEEIRQSFEAAGWQTGGPVGEEEAEQLALTVRGESDKYAIVAHRSVMMLENPTFELIDTESKTVIWVREVPDPRRAAELLAGHGVPATEADTMDPTTAPLPPTISE